MPQPGKQPGTSNPAINSTRSRSSDAAHGRALVTRARVLSNAYELFSRRSIRDVGVNELIETSGVAKSTFYRHFPSKDDLIKAVLAFQHEVWFEEIVAEAQRRSDTPEEELLVIFDVFADRLGSGGYKSNMLIRVLMEMGPDHPLGMASVEYLARIRGHVRVLAEGGGLERCHLFARAWHLLLKGSIISTMEGDRKATELAKQMASCLIERHRRAGL
ncbi:TetR/AcrR family transcriptional regulator [Arthrobacter globiformis]|uniref:TetR/AcrR family transcriptional regulator n=1 Tax=Arthrobacter globiformis TaxID=1665 RepID=UPI00278335DC|nr:TetR/AcrR family transcriptional regulator [Arthrobacter globiformis]MDQ0867396.1 AcrR family transcriptional regulator [Arthrobacter globiformis]